jgi:hypothetical protein
MPTLSAQVVLSSTTLFPNPASVSLTATEVVSGSAEYQYRIISASSTTILYGPSAKADASETVYFYAAAPSSNTVTLTLNITGSNTSASSAVILQPGDWTWIPLRVSGSGVTVSAVNTTTTSSLLNVFYGERS